MKPTLALLLALTAAHAGPRTSASYSVATDTADSGGKRATSTSYTNDGSAGGVAGISTVAAPAETAKSGYIGQLYDVTGLTLHAASLTMNEGTTDQLAASQLLDDATSLPVPAASVSWSVASGPLTSISASGLATAAIVYQNTLATAQGDFEGLTGQLEITVLDTIPDNFGSYTDDGVGDNWQVQYFGQPPNANAGPNADFDGTGQTNLFKYTAGLNPLDGSRFTLNIAPVPLQPAQMNLIFSPIVAGRTYTPTCNTDLSGGTWLTVPGATFTDSGMQRTLTDPAATGPTKFYRIEITKP